MTDLRIKRHEYRRETGMKAQPDHRRIALAVDNTSAADANRRSNRWGSAVLRFVLLLAASIVLWGIIALCLWHVVDVLW